MSGIDKMSATIKKKMSLNDYKPAIEPTNMSKNTAQQKSKKAVKNEFIDQSPLPEQVEIPSPKSNPSLQTKETIDLARPLYLKPHAHSDATHEQDLPHNGKSTSLEYRNAHNIKSSPSYLSGNMQAAKPRVVVKTTVYFTEEAKRKFDEIYGTRILKGIKADMSELICEAIDLLYENEKQS